LQRIKSPLPEVPAARKPSVHARERRRVEAVQPALCPRSRYDETGLAQHAKVFRDGWLAYRESFAQLARSLLARSQALDDAAPHRVCDSGKRFHLGVYNH
jgi:hypothetical protein